MLAGLLPPGTRRPATLRGSVAYTATLGDYCFQTAYDEALAGPEQDGILIKTNSGRQNTGESLLAALTLIRVSSALAPWRGVSGHEKHSGRILGMETRSLTAGGPVYPCG